MLQNRINIIQIWIKDFAQKLKNKNTNIVSQNLKNLNIVLQAATKKVKVKSALLEKVWKIHLWKKRV